MERPVPPADYEELIRVIHERYDSMSKGYQTIALYLTQNPNDVAVRSVNALAERLRRARLQLRAVCAGAGVLGVQGPAGALPEAAVDRGAGVRGAGAGRCRGSWARGRTGASTGFLRDLVVRDVASLQELLDDVGADDLRRATDLLEKAEVVYLLGQLRSAPVVELLRYILTMLGKRCVLLDASGGLATHMARAMREGDVLVAVSFRFYATEVVNIVEEAAGRGTAIIAISDSTLSPLAKSAEVLFAVPEHEYTFSRSLAAPMCLAQALAVALAARLQGDAEAPRIPTVTSR